MKQFATQAPTSPAAGSNLTITVPAGQNWLVNNFGFILSTSATVANRNAGITVRDSLGNTMFSAWAASSSVASYNHGASSIIQYWFGTGCRTDFGPIQSQLGTSVPEFKLGEGFTISTDVNNLQAADQVEDVVLSYVQKYYL